MSQSQLDLIKLEISKSSPFLELCSLLSVNLSENWCDKFGVALLKWAKQSIHNPIKTLSLFTGAGGLDIGFHDAGFTVQTMIEINDRFVSTLELNTGLNNYFGPANVVCDDIRNYMVENNQYVDFIIGGPPCQPFSAAGRRAAGVQGTSEERGVLFKEFVRLVRELSPKGFLFENVYGIIGAENGEAWNNIKSAFKDVGYNISYRILDAADYGVPQHRERLFIVGVKDGDYFFPAPTHGPDSPNGQPYYTASQAFRDVLLTEEEKNREVGGRYGELLKDIPPSLNYSFYTEKMGHPNPIFAWRSKFSDFLYKAAPDFPVRTIKAQGGLFTGPFHWENRPFSIGELKRLQTIPDKYKIAGERQATIHQIGNSVPPQLARMLALSILNQVFNIGLPKELPYLEPNKELGFRKRKRLLTEHYKRTAKEAISKMEKQSHKEKIARRSYKALVTQDFNWIKIKGKKKGIFVKFMPKKSEWIFKVSENNEFNEACFEIIVVHDPKNAWSLEVNRVVLFGFQMNQPVFVGLWKAFEYELMHLGIKADLVQLSGYYQYKPSIEVNMSFLTQDEVDERWKIVKRTVAGKGVGNILRKESLAEIWGVNTEDVFRYCMFLRDLGYEVRNKNTNPQIPAESFLIPYPFPTLTSKSVQLRKSLGSSDE